MSERGVFAVDRGLWSHPMFAREPFSEREAWLWLISEASWKPRPWRIDGRVVELERGQLCHSVRFMAEAWQWSKSRVDRFLSRLVAEGMIGTTAGQSGGTKTAVLTICNYDDFQAVGLPERDNVGTEERDNSGTMLGQNRRKKTLKNIVPPLPPGGPQAAPADGAGLFEPEEQADPIERDFEAFWAAYPKRLGDNPRKPALAAYRRARKAKHDPERILASVRAMAAHWAKRPAAERNYIPRASTWLNEERWVGQAPKVVAPEAGDAQWRSLLEAYRANGWWSHRGPKPGQPGCPAPAHLLTEYGYDLRPMAKSA